MTRLGRAVAAARRLLSGLRREAGTADGRGPSSPTGAVDELQRRMQRIASSKPRFDPIWVGRPRAKRATTPSGETSTTTPKSEQSNVRTIWRQIRSAETAFVGHPLSGRQWRKLRKTLAQEATRRIREHHTTGTTS